MTQTKHENRQIMETKDICFCEESFIDRSFLVLTILRWGWGEGFCDKIYIKSSDISTARPFFVKQIQLSYKNRMHSVRSFLNYVHSLSIVKPLSITFKNCKLMKTFPNLWKKNKCCSNSQKRGKRSHKKLLTNFPLTIIWKIL